MHSVFEIMSFSWLCWDADIEHILASLTINDNRHTS
jgi:hypothetical protein